MELSLDIKSLEDSMLGQEQVYHRNVTELFQQVIALLQYFMRQEMLLFHSLTNIHYKIIINFFFLLFYIFHLK